MFKVIMFVCKKETLSTEEFIARWQLHSEKVSQFRTVLNIKAYTKTFPSKPEHSPSTDRKTLPLFLMQWGNCGTKIRRNLLMREILLQANRR